MSHSKKSPIAMPPMSGLPPERQPVKPERDFEGKPTVRKLETCERCFKPILDEVLRKRGIIKDSTWCKCKTPKGQGGKQ